MNDRNQSALARVNPDQEVGAGIQLTRFEDALRFSEMIAKTDFIPQSFKGNSGNVFAALQMGAELGLAPMQSLQNIAVINGRPSVWGDAMLALIQSHPECEDVVEEVVGAGTSMVATCAIKRRGRTAVVRSFSMEEAKIAGLAGKQGPWQQYPKRMLQMRARGFACRDAFPDRLRGFITVEEAQDHPAQTIETPVGTVITDPTPAAPTKGNDALKKQLASAAPKPAATSGKVDHDAIIKEAFAFIAACQFVDELTNADWSMLEGLTEKEKSTVREAVKKRGSELKKAGKLQRPAPAATQQADHDPVTGEVQPTREREPGDDDDEAAAEEAHRKAQEAQREAGAGT